MNGNIGVMKCMMTGVSKCLLELSNEFSYNSIYTELTDSTNMAKGFAMMPVMWSIGATVGYVLASTFSSCD